MKSVRIGVIDSGIVTSQLRLVERSKIFIPRSYGHEHASLWDKIEHGSKLIDLIHSHNITSRFLVARVFAMERIATVHSIVAAIEWLIAESVDIINLSFGMKEESRPLARVCERARLAGITLVASTTSIPNRVYPAAFASCIAVASDVRCSPENFSWIGSEFADFGAHPFYTPMDPEHGGGSSFACARMTGILAARLSYQGPKSISIEALRQGAAIFGPDKRPTLGDLRVN
ncbi:hypothetical protein RY831_27000 [Noviherbaspirillum sp. CPCC 100848]|uniref:Peptidase S8/S53 domain-containing protein n=1 Tax=Noviherbaspirillum album TaxID=3080276 RepID=A0ABU6JGM0_9BURK|nr:S8 family serine peptidase [Noviherbaspirillum sp. CPCC 100848]MEC4722812.1 hypothetical protein [Noviherbaspirillum sp. CPCC 100848]